MQPVLGMLSMSKSGMQGLQELRGRVDRHSASQYLREVSGGLECAVAMSWWDERPPVQPPAAQIAGPGVNFRELHIACLNFLGHS